MAFHVWKKALGCTTFHPHWKVFFNPKAPLLAQKNDALRLIRLVRARRFPLKPLDADPVHAQHVHGWSDEGWSVRDLYPDQLFASAGSWVGNRGSVPR